MMFSASKIAGIVVLLVCFLRATTVLGERGEGRWLGPEALRKIVHMGLGVVCLGFPWMFDSVAELAVLGVCVLALLLGVRSVPLLRVRLGGGLHGVERNSIGDLLFGVSVVLLFIYARETPALYVLPLLILTLSDSAAALTGTRFGRHFFTIPSGRKSWEGTFAFCGVTVLLSGAVLWLLTPLAPAEVVCIALLLGIVGCMVEAVSWYGADNLLVPLGMHLLLGGLVEKSPHTLVLTLLFLAGFILCMLKISRFGQLSTHALIGSAIAAFFFWETGGPLWLAGPVIVFMCHVLFAVLQGKDDEYGYRAVLSVISCGIVWLFVYRHSLYPFAFLLFVLSMAIHLQIIVLLRIRTLRGRQAEYPLVLAVCLFSGWVFLPVLLFFYGIDAAHSPLYLSALALMAAGGIAFRVKGEGDGGGRWLRQTAYAMGGSLLGLVPVWVFTQYY